MMLLKSPVSARWWPVAIAEALAVVKVGNSEWLFLNDTPASRSAAMVGAVFWSTISARSPSGMNSTTLCGRSAAAADDRAAPARTQVSAKHFSRFVIVPPTVNRGRTLGCNCYRLMSRFRAERRPAARLEQHQAERAAYQHQGDHVVALNRLADQQRARHHADARHDQHADADHRGREHAHQAEPGEIGQRVGTQPQLDP